MTDRTSNQYCIERNGVVTNLRVLAEREYRLTIQNPDDHSSRKMLASLAWAIQHLDGLPEHWVAVESSADETSPGQSKGDARWALLRKILDESVETGELPSGLHEAFQMGGDEMVAWLDKRLPEEPSGAQQRLETAIMIRADQESCPACGCLNGNYPRLGVLHTCIAVKASALQPACIWRDGCKHPEVCKSNLRCVPGGIEGQS